ncbi:MAG: hypothetical protein ABI939_11070 [Anaerolineaceae bacterium]
MSNPRTIHLVPQPGGYWEVRMAGFRLPLQFPDLGRALDAATATTAGGAPTRVVIHEPQSAA